MSPLAQAVEAAPARTRPAAPRTRPAPGTRGAEKTRLRLVVPDIARRRVPFSVVCTVVLLLGMLGVLLLNIVISHSTYRVEQLSAEQVALEQERDRLTEDISYRESPQNIAAAAEELGMERDLDPEYLRLSDGEILSPGQVPGNSLGNPETAPGPRADAREDVRPNLRSEDRLAPVGSDEQMQAPEQRAPE